MSSSASKSKPKKTSNLRILWIPGRKKHNRKGTFNATKSGLPQTYGMQPRKIEPWTLGGPLNHSKIINAELPEHHLDLATMAGITTGAMSLVSKGPTDAGAVCDAVPQIATTELNGSSTNPEAIANTSEQPQPVEDGEAVGGRSSPSSTIVVPIELNNLNGGDVATNKEKEIATSNQFEALALIDEDEETEVKDRNCSNAQSSSSLLSSNNDNRSVENVHNGSTLAIGEQQQNKQQQQQPQHNRQRRRSTTSKKNSADEDIDSIDRADSAVDMVRALAEREPHLFEYLDNGVPYLKRKPRTPCVVMMRKERRRTRSRKRSTVRRRSQQACSLQATKPTEKQELLDEVDEKKKKDPDDAAVECLYWSLVCWDCNIL